MAIKLKGRKNSPLGNLASALATTIMNQGDSLATPQITKAVISLESHGHDVANAQSALDQARALLRGHLKSEPSLLRHFGLEAIADASPEQIADAEARLETALDAGAVAMMAVGNPQGYAEAAYRGQAVAEPGVTVIDSLSGDGGAGMDYRGTVAMEAFNDKELRDHLPFSVLFNVFASRQDDFSEMFFPTTVVTPDQAGLDVTVARMTVFNEVRHSSTGNKVDFGKRNLIDAAVDHTVLADEHTRLVPVVLEDNSNADKFVPAAQLAPFPTAVGNYAVPTSALVLDKVIDLIGISQYQPLVGAGVIDSSDDVDARVALDEVFLAPEAGAKLVRFPVGRLARTQFNKSVEGNSREMQLTFNTTDLVIDKDTTAADSSAVAKFAGIIAGKYTVRLATNITGTLNVEFGNVQVWASSVSVASIQDENGNIVPTTSGAGAQIVTDLAGMKVLGYTLRANRTNANKRTRGHLLDTVYETARYTIPLGSPLSIISPVAADGGRDAADQRSLIAAARMRNSNNAVTALLDIADQLREVTKGPKLPANCVIGIGGLGRYLVDAFFEEHDLDLVQSINSIKSQDRAQDVSATLVNAVRDIAYRMYQSTKIQPAIDALTGTAGEAPILLVGTDQVLIRHLLVNGDSRTFGTVFDKAVVKASTDRRVYGKIFISMSRQNAEGPDPLTFGTHGWMSELISLMPISRNGAVTKEATVQPRTLHINNMPVLAVINVKGLSQALVDKTATPALSSAGVTNVYLNGLKYPQL